MRAIFEIVGMLLAVSIASVISPVAGLLLCLLVLVVSGISILRPIPSLRLPSRGYNFAVFLLVGFLGLIIPAAAGIAEQERTLASLKESNPTEYLAKLEKANKTRWLTELETLDPARHEQETARLAAEQTRVEAEAEAARIALAAEEAKIREEQEAKQLAIDAERQIAESTRNKERMLSLVSSMDWEGARHLIPALSGLGAEQEAFMAQIEAEAIPKVKAIPASDLITNLKGYKFLAALAPENTEYAEKSALYQSKIVEEEARRVAKAEQEKRAAISKLNKKVDKVEGVTYFYHPNRPKYVNSRSTVYLYIGRQGEDGRPWLRMVVQYAASDWLFVDNVQAWFDGVKEPLISGQFRRDNNTKIWEWQDVSPTGSQVLTLESLSNAQEAILRFDGSQYRKDVTISASDKKAIREVLAAYSAMLEGM